jgi:hypothetical protein
LLFLLIFLKNVTTIYLSLFIGGSCKIECTYCKMFIIPLSIVVFSAFLSKS